MLVLCESRRPLVWNKGCCPRITCTMFRCRRLAATPSNLTFSHETARRFSAIGIPSITNEPFLQYAPGSSERVKVLAACKSARDECPDIPLVINGQAVRTGDIGRQVLPSQHGHTLCTFHRASAAQFHEAVSGALKARRHWESTPLVDRIAVALKAAEIISGPRRAQLCAATMIGTGKNMWQAEIDVGTEMPDFLRFGSKYAAAVHAQQPADHSAGVWNRLEYRGLEGFVAAISPFNFLAIGCNLVMAPAIMGNVVVWKPSDTAILGSYRLLEALHEAGMPPGVIQFVPGIAEDCGRVLTESRHLAALHFTGSTSTFNHLWRSISDNITNYHTYPRIVGETGGKNFHFIHSSADADSVAIQSVRGAFEYSGQKCSATSRMYVPQSLWPRIKERMVEITKSLHVGQPDDPTSFMSAVIDQRSFDKISGFIQRAKADPDVKLLVGGNCDSNTGFFISPTILESGNPKSETMTHEIFGPVLTVFVYPDAHEEEVLQLLASTSPYALTGSVFARDRSAIARISAALRDCAGNFYINDKCTGAMVGQQPFGGARSSGTNDKAGSAAFMTRWTSVQSIKESFLSPTTHLYPSNMP